MKQDAKGRRKQKRRTCGPQYLIYKTDILVKTICCAEICNIQNRKYQYSYLDQAELDFNKCYVINLIIISYKRYTDFSKLKISK